MKTEKLQILLRKNSAILPPTSTFFFFFEVLDSGTMRQTKYLCHFLPLKIKSTAFLLVDFFLSFSGTMISRVKKKNSWWLIYHRLSSLEHWYQGQVSTIGKKSCIWIFFFFWLFTVCNTCQNSVYSLSPTQRV